MDQGLISRAWYHAATNDFRVASRDAILGELTRKSDFSVDPSQRDAWLEQLAILQECLDGISGFIFLEFSIPRMGRRIDAVLLVGASVLVIEFKVGAVSFDRSAIDQVWDYALDLKNFHSASHTAVVVPILVATGARGSDSARPVCDADNVYRPLLTNSQELRPTIDKAISQAAGPTIDSQLWATASYQPTPTIVEAARCLYANHSVDAIARFDAGAKNLRVTSRRLEELVDDACKAGRKLICFVTGVPGAGKTLVGLNIATRRGDESNPTHAVFLSGNGPLVAVLREALTRDGLTRKRSRGEKITKGKVGHGVKQFIQNVHHFRDEYLADTAAPDEHVVIFDEAQRAWNLHQTANFMSRKKKRPGFNQSEPEFLISCMDRRADWAVIICLVGGGQEINTGEAGIAAWLEALNKSFPRWEICISSRLVDSEYAAGEAVQMVSQRATTHFDDDLHLAVSMRSFRAENVSAFVKALLDCDRDSARNQLATFKNRYSIFVTRDLARAKEWVRTRARASERFGLVASSKAQRLKPHAVDIRVNIDPVVWFLNDKEDTRSSFYLEDAATEFQVQGLELDWTCVTWDGDMRYAADRWTYHDFRGSRWTNIANPENQNYLRNAYRVLLTRARQGMVIFVPPGDRRDPTRLPEQYDATYSYLTEIGIPILD